MSEHDRKVLDEIEQELVRSSPWLVRKLRRGPKSLLPLLYDAAAVLSGLTALLCLLVIKQGTAGAALLAGILMVVILAARHHQFPRRSKNGSTDGSGLART
ncbi:DUF3040 domain-containing protein [Pseudonocardia thermophila]|uniref:DUF3040 domain-containing protein n=1 Tax=Pseudonocardia thermophila TaxID=1848 RepID=UPI0013565838|nr:DUF3040 domain-containing protein [Pseudonocardia thermophila]